MVLGGYGTRASLLRADRPVLDIPITPVNTADLIRPAIARKRAVLDASRARVIFAVVLEDVRLAGGRP